MKNRIVSRMARLSWAALILAGAPAFAQEELEFHGYVRTGGALNTDLVNAPNGVNSNLVGRLGNEDNSWVDAELVHKLTADDGVWSKVHLNFTGTTDTTSATTTGTNPALLSSSKYNVTEYLSEAYVEIGGLAFDPQAAFFVGEKQNREDIHIMDFKWRKFDGFGFGVTGALGGRLDFSALTSDTTLASIPLTFDARFKLTPQLQLEGGVAYTKNSKLVTSDSTTASSGFQGAIVYYWDRFYGLPGWMTVAAQAGTGMFGAALSSTASWSALGSLGNVYAKQDSYALRLITSGTGQFGQLEVAAGVWTEYDYANQTTWSSSAGANVASKPYVVVAAAFRPAWKFDHNFSLEGEVGVSDEMGGGYYWDSSTSTSYLRNGVSYKVTLAPTLALDSSVGARPQLRVFVTYDGRDGSLGAVSADSKQNHEVKFGVQAESWW
jgi:maltoporin